MFDFSCNNGAQPAYQPGHSREARGCGFDVGKGVAAGYWAGQKVGQEMSPGSWKTAGAFIAGSVGAADGASTAFRGSADCQKAFCPEKK